MADFESRTGVPGRAIFTGLLLICVVVVAWLAPLGAWFTQAAAWLAMNPISGSLLFVLAFVLGSVLMVPGSVLMMSAGLIFGWPAGSVLALLGTAGGALAACIVSRGLLKERLAEKFADNDRVRAIDSAIETKGFLIVVLTRLSLIIPYNVLNYMYGLTRVRLPTLTIATGVGMVPAVLLYVYLGSLARNADELLAGDVDTGVAGKVLLIGGLVCIVAAMLVIHRTATKILREELDQ